MPLDLIRVQLAALTGGIEMVALPWLPDWWPLSAAATEYGLIALAASAALFALFLTVRRVVETGLAARAAAEEDDEAQQPAAQPAASARRSELRAALVPCRSAFLATALFSALINILMLTGAIFMMEIYDRVLPSRSVATLVGLAIIAGALFAAQGALELIRSRLLARVGAALDEALCDRVFDMLTRLPLKMGPKGEIHQPVRDLDSIRSFFAGSGPSALLDLPWLPFYLLIIFAFHPLLGVTALIGGLILVAITVTTEFMTREPTRTATAYGARRNTLAEASRRNAEVVAAMGMGPRLGATWRAANAEYLGGHQRASDVAGGFGSLSKTLRFMLQSGMLAVGAWLVIQGQATGGVIIAGSILLGRALAPVDGVIANARNFINARQSWSRLSKLLEALPPPKDPLSLPPPRDCVTVMNLILAPPGTQTLQLHDVNFSIGAGQTVGIIGPSGSGKSCLTRALVGAWQPTKGKVQLDGASLNQWSSEALGRHIGYVPQDVELFSGSIASNICRFEPNPDSNAIISAAQAAGVHDLILSFPEGYETQIGDQGAALSAGQRQRIALARALYRDPFLVVLDEPNSNLDVEGERALIEAIQRAKARGAIVIVVTHRTSVLAVTDQILAMQQGRIMGPVRRDDVYANLNEGRPLPLIGGKLSPSSTQIIVRDPAQSAKLKHIIDGDRPPDTVMTLSVERRPPGDTAAAKPRLRLAARKDGAQVVKPEEPKS